MTSLGTTSSLHSAALLRSVLAALVVVALLVALIIVPASAASKDCSVKNKATGRTYGTLQAAVNAAKPWATLHVHGTCRGTTVIDRSLQIRGVTTRSRGAPRLTDGAPMVTVQRGHTVSLADITMRPRGLQRDSDYNHVGGRAIYNRGTLVATDILVDGGRGIRNAGTLRLLGDSRVQRTYGGVVNKGRLVMAGTASIRGNDAYGLAWSVRNTGTLVMYGRSSIGRNGWHGCSNCSGGGVLNRGRWIMNHESSLSGQRRASAITNHGTLVMDDRSSIRNNSDGGTIYGWHRGGGVENHGSLVMNGSSSIHHNGVYDSWDQHSQGGGVYNLGTLSMRDTSSIHDNGPRWWSDDVAAPVDGGGIFNAKGGTLAGVTCGTGGNVYSNTPDDCYSE